ncbi:MAG TPA: alanine--tRNA ligase [Steroidobacteraceae bacterium]|nr:alanine--tRNA ligase [Steroidobacteraceae bacterium]
MTDTAAGFVSSAELRSRFLEYFKRHGHTIVASSPLVPGNDPTLLFTNAGMVQFKDVFLGKERRPYRRAVTAQRCVRAGGKHNDLENVGYTARHHTFFEMLGNFSFGDYFKRDAIRLAWEFITRDLGLPKERLWITVFETDDEAFALWVEEAGVAADRIARLGVASNFWAMGDTGPCGPCSEIFYDHGPGIAGGPPGSADEGDRYVEIWNLVFMQYERSADGVLNPLPKPSVDTGMGLERVAAVMQGVHSNYDIDLFKDIIAEAARVTGTRELGSPSLKVIADHIRACSFLIVDGVLPSNEGRGYVLRRIIRRAVRHGYQLGQTQPFFHLLVDVLVRQMGAAYPELASGAEHVKRVLAQEEARFAETLASGMAILETAIAGLGAAGTRRTIPGETVFKLYDTFGFPVDLTADIARERGLRLDEAGFETAMNAQRERARAASRFGVDLRESLQLDHRTEFRGYESLVADGTIVALLDEAGGSVAELAQGARGRVVLDRTPFYAEGGGQVGDTGTLAAEGGDFEVEDTQKIRDAHAHTGIVTRGRLKVGERVTAVVAAAKRAATARNHSATHLLHAALRAVLGRHVQQKGSLVEPERLRFDFSHPAPVTSEELARIEKLVNAEVLANREAAIRLMSYDAALASGAVALFGEKYGDVVRVLSFGDFSTELCGGTHVHRTGDIGLLKVTNEGGVAAGVRRIEAVTGEAALAYLTLGEHFLAEIARLVRGGREDAVAKVATLVDRSRRLEKEIEQLKGRLASGKGIDLAAGAIEIGGAKIVATRLDGLDAKALRAAVDQLKESLGRAVIVLGSVDSNGKVLLVAGVTPDLTQRIGAGELAAAAAAKVGGRGGGRPDFAQAGGPDASQLDAALTLVGELAAARLG